MKTLFILTVLLLLSLSCTNNDDELVNSGKPMDSMLLKNRTCEAGSYTISSGRIVFDDVNEYYQTLDFLSCATAGDIADWADEFEIVTAGKAYREFEDLICDEEISDEDFEDLLEEYEGKIKATEVYQDGIYSYEIQPLFTSLNEIFNLNGEFQIDTSVYKLVGNNFVSICSPTLVDPSTVDEETETDTINKLFVHEFVVALLGGCCPVLHEEIHHYGSSPRKRLKETYAVVDLTTAIPLSLEGLYLIRPALGIDIHARSQKRRGFIIHWWTCHNVNLSFDFDISFLHNFGPFGISNPAEFDFQATPTSECKIDHGDGLAGNAFIGFADEVPPGLSVCVTDVFEELINTSDISNPTASFECD